MSILFWSVESSIGRFREKGKELVIQERQYKIFYFKYKKVKSLKVSTFKLYFFIPFPNRVLGFKIVGGIKSQSYIKLKKKQWK